jgi:hypothetical protein
MNVEIRTEAPIFLFWDYVFQILGILSLQCTSKEYSVHRKLRFKRFKGLAASPTLFVYFLYFFVHYIHSYIHSPRVHSCFLIALRSVEGLPGVPSRDSNSGQPVLLTLCDSSLVSTQVVYFEVGRDLCWPHISYLRIHCEPKD